MTATNLMGAAMSVPQWVIVSIITVGIVIFLLGLGRLLYILLYKPDLKARLRKEAKIFREQKKRLIAETELAEAEILKSTKEIDAKTEKARLLNSETERLRLELVQQGLREDEARRISEMTLDQLIVLKGKEQKDLSGNFIINAITRKVLIDSDFERRTDIEDFKVPVNITKEFSIETIIAYTETLFDVTGKFEDTTAMNSYKILNKSFAVFINRKGSFTIQVKCGTYYGQRLTQLYPQFFSKSRYPASMLWFDVKMEGCSLELIKLLILISYNIAKAGY